MGTGIAADRLGRIFEPCFTTKPPGQGAGLGLTLAKIVVEAHGGEIRVESHVGRRTTCTILLPKAVPADADREGHVHRP